MKPYAANLIWPSWQGWRKRHERKASHENSRIEPLGDKKKENKQSIMNDIKPLTLELTMEQKKHENEACLSGKELRFLRLPDVCRKLGISRSTVYLWITQNRFHAPLKIGRMSVWPESQVNQWMRDKEMEAKNASEL